MANYTQDAIDALTTLREEGLEITLTRKTPEPFDPVAGEITYGEDLNLTLTGIIKSPKTFRGNTGFDEKLETAITLGRAKVFFCAAYGLAFPPVPGDLVELNDISYKVHAITTLEPGGVPITHNLTLIQE